MAGKVKLESERAYLLIAHRQGGGEMSHQPLGLLPAVSPISGRTPARGLSCRRRNTRTCGGSAPSTSGSRRRPSGPSRRWGSPSSGRRPRSRRGGAPAWESMWKSSGEAQASALLRGDAYGDVSLQGNAQRMEVLHRIQQLPVQVVLGEDVEGYLGIEGTVLRIDACEQFRGAAGVLSPAGEIGGAVAVPQGAEGASRAGARTCCCGRMKRNFGSAKYPPYRSRTVF